MLFVSGDDSLNEGIPDNIFSRQFAKGDAFNGMEDFLSHSQSRLLIGW
jgi:hypothetical protein